MPFVSEILELAGVDPTPSIGRVISLIAAYPTTVVHDLWVGPGVPIWDFGSTQVQSRPGEQAHAGASDRNGFGLNLAAGVVQFIWSGVDVMLDLMDINMNKPNSSATTKAQYESDEWFLNIADWSLPMLMTVLQWPTPVNGGTTQPLSQWNFTDSAAWGQDCTFQIGVVVTTIVPWLVQLAAQFATAKDDDENGGNGGGDDGGGGETSPAEVFEDTIVPFLQMGAGAANAVLGTWWQWDNYHASKTDKANAVLDWVLPNLSYIDVPLALDKLVESSEGGTLYAKMIIDLIANYGATAFCFQAAVAAYEAS